MDIDESPIDPHVLNPRALQNLLRNEVEVKIANGKLCRGWIHSIDPISKSLILLKFEENLCESVFIPGYNLKYVQILDSNPSPERVKIIDNVFKKEEVQYSSKDIEKRREALCLWFGVNRVPYSVTDGFNIEVLQAATILPPYSKESINCKNEVVLDKVMKLVSNVPGLDNKQV